MTASNNPSIGPIRPGIKQAAAFAVATSFTCCLALEIRDSISAFGFPCSCKAASIRALHFDFCAADDFGRSLLTPSKASRLEEYRLCSTRSSNSDSLLPGRLDMNTPEPSKRPSFLTFANALLPSISSSKNASALQTSD